MTFDKSHEQFHKFHCLQESHFEISAEIREMPTIRMMRNAKMTAAIRVLPMLLALLMVKQQLVAGQPTDREINQMGAASIARASVSIASEQESLMRLKSDVVSKCTPEQLQSMRDIPMQALVGGLASFLKDEFSSGPTPDKNGLFKLTVLTNVVEPCIRADAQLRYWWNLAAGRGNTPDDQMDWLSLAKICRYLTNLSGSQIDGFIAATYTAYVAPANQ